MAGKAIRQSINPGTKAFCFVFVFCGQVLVKLASLSVVLPSCSDRAKGVLKLKAPKREFSHASAISNKK